MDKNIAAILREDARTISVAFEPIVDENEAFDLPHQRVHQKRPPAKKYTYVTHLPVKIGDTVIVDAKGVAALATVLDVHETIQIEPNSTTHFKWVIGVVDVAAAAANEARNREIEQHVAQAYQANARAQFRALVLGQAGEGAESLQRLIGGTNG